MAIIQDNYKALGSEIIITLKVSENVAVDNHIFGLIRQTIRRFEKKFSRFLPKSELSYVNLKAGRAVSISDDFVDLAWKSIKASIATDGLFNPFILPALQNIGYVGSWSEVQKEQPNLNFSNRRICSVQDIKLGINLIEIPSHSALDFGGIGKGYILDKIAGIIDSQRFDNYWLSFGGDIICSGSDISGHGWQIGIASARDNSKQIDTIYTNGEKIAIATSGITKRKGIKKGNEWHHIIDPRTGLPAQSDIITATVVTETAILADVYAKTLVIMGADRAKDFVKNKEIKMAILQTKNKLPVKIIRE